MCRRTSEGEVEEVEVEDVEEDVEEVEAGAEEEGEDSNFQIILVPATLPVLGMVVKKMKKLAGH